jgi:hypothetical protein
MKNNIEQTKKFLDQALRSLPSDFAFQGVKSHIIAAINQTHAVEYKRARHENTQKQIAKLKEDQQKAMAAGYAPWQMWQMSLPQARQAINHLDNMINSELSKLAENKRKSTPDVPGLFID